MVATVGLPWLSRAITFTPASGLDPWVEGAGLGVEGVGVEGGEGAERPDEEGQGEGHELGSCPGGIRAPLISPWGDTGMVTIVSR